MAQLNSLDPRIGKVKGQILKHAMHREVLQKAGEMKPFPKNMGEIISYRRFIPFGATESTFNQPQVNVQEHVLQEGITPEADELQKMDIEARMDQYGAQYYYTDKVKELYEDDIPAEQVRQIGERFGLLREMIRWGIVRTCMNRFYAGGTSRSTVSETVSLPMLRRIARNLEINHAMRVNKMGNASNKFGTRPIESSYVVFTHTDLESDIRDIPGFTKVVEYNTPPICPEEVGSVEQFRFVVSPELRPYLGGGASIGSTGLLGSGNVDVYPLIVTGQDAWASLQLRGHTSLEVNHIGTNVISKDDMLGQRGYVAAKMWDSAFVQNDGWMAVYEAGASTLA